MSKNKIKEITKKAVNIANITAANSTTCGLFYQPKAPIALKNFSRIKNDK